jgi:hypothetical protein
MNTDLNPIPFSPIYPWAPVLELFPTLQIATKFSWVKPSLLHSTTIC